MPRNTKCTEEILSAIEDFLSQNVSEADAAAACGINPRTFSRWLHNPDIFDRMAQAKSRGKASLIKAANAASTTGFTVRERRVESTEMPDGGVINKIVEITRELPPDHRATFSMLRAKFPEEFGHVNRLDVKKVGGLHTGQIDKDMLPTKAENPRAILEMVLDGNGKYGLDEDIEEDEAEEIPALAVGFIDEDI